jgi:hypothetical protein
MAWVTAAGLTMQESLPPFMPIGRAQDLVFGTLLHCAGEVAIAFLPEMVVHKRPPNERCLPRFDVAKTFYASNRILSWILLSTGEEISDTDDALARMGECLVSLGELPENSFKKAVEELWDDIRSKLLTKYEELLLHYAAMPAFWQEDLRRIQHDLSGTPELLQDIGHSSAQRVADFKERVTLFGRVLAAWEKITH